MGYSTEIQSRNLEFMLSAIKASLVKALDMSDGMSDAEQDKSVTRWSKIEDYVNAHSFIMNAGVRDLCGVSAATANRTLAKLVEEGKLIKCREGGHWAYRLSDR